MASTTPLSNLPQSEIDAIIRTKRKVREPKACYPCHTRKVKCDRNLPCDGCVKRDHADLCSYERPSKKRHVNTPPPPDTEDGARSLEGAGNVSVGDIEMHGMAADAERVSISKVEWESVCSKLKDMECAMSSLRAEMERVDANAMYQPQTALVSPEPPIDQARLPRDEPLSDREGIHAKNEYGNGTVHLGSRSVLAYLLGGSSKEATQALLEGGLLPKLGLDNETATYPFIDLWSSDSSSYDIKSVCAAIPDDKQCRMLFKYYRNIAAIIYPVLSDIERFEEKFELTLRNRAAFGISENDNDEVSKPFGMPTAFIGLLFAVLAAGCQSSDMSGKERELTSQVYVCCSYQFLRATNFLSQPTLEAIQTLLIIGNVLSYNMNPGVSYVLLGMSLRMGMSLGLHVESHKFSPTQQYARRVVWWATAWQDSHFSLSYDRPSAMAFSHPDVPYHPESQPGRRSYFETICQLISLTLNIVRSRMLSTGSQVAYSTIQTYRAELKRILADTAPYLRDPMRCTSLSQNVERLGLKLHSSYITSEICRPSLRQNADLNDATTIALRKDCITALSLTVEGYVELYSVNPQAARSWIGLQRAISSAFLLAVVGESKTDPNIWTLLRRLEVVLTERATEDDSSYISRKTGAGSSSPFATSSTKRASANLAEASLETPYDPTATAVLTSIPTDTETQWAKPLIKSLRALQKLNAALAVHLRQNGAVPTTGSAYTPASIYPQTVPPAVASSVTSARAGSIPPPTPESSASGEWSFPTLLDRAAEYIDPPLW
ncbi:uncharacterized protein GIQ15_06713 [Arthroderma uncinatum]|uniref:uncharacterized protein n=1 Tax=Arthroderma uncinatum TaxID=74035 RepID=UPI00144A6106|nr:uncharacterized protein GIQ15_06713 [Arthroderma uncinatum]KAF3479737.1 hypothetical protein GIQ15_06713 [Arthroderma uncinatum]